ncbi:Glutamate decarboxylase 2 [Beggiatoa sp. PS]|nr:Glutamate decarboxylase 2 [Beggiatoa sp. PS]
MIYNTKPPQIAEFVNETYDCREENLNSLLEKISTIKELLSLDNDVPKHPITKSFDYPSELANLSLSEDGRTSEDVLGDLKDMLAGSIRANSELSFFNILTTPLLDTVAANTMLNLYNSVVLMDAFGGKLLLYEQKVAHLMGNLIGWESAYGISCNGGKLTMLYALKSAISKIAPEANREGIPKDMAVITNEGAHYSIEHVCAFLGLGSDRCFRVPCNDDWQMDQTALSHTIEKLHTKGLRVAAVICCAGTTINFVCDDIAQVFDTVNKSVKSLSLDYVPYIHVDSVIGWLWYSFLEQRGSDRLTEIDSSIVEQIEQVTQRLTGVHLADSFGIDFHKNGLCPFPTSFFVTKQFENFNRLTDGCYQLGEKDLRFGQLRPYRYTVENSRPATGIATAWIALQRLGITGLQSYLLKLKYVCLTFSDALDSLSLFEVLNRHTFGWEVVFSIQFSKLLQHYPSISEEVICNNFIEYLWEKVNHGEALPLISIVPGYQAKASYPKRTAFLFFPMLHSLNNIKIHKAVGLLSEQVSMFEQAVCDGKLRLKNTQTERPIR